MREPAHARRWRCYARLAPLALVAVPAAALAAMSSEQVIAEAAKLPRQVPGLYRASFAILGLDSPVNSKEIAETLRSAIEQEQPQDSETCITPEEADQAAGEFVHEILGDRCAFDRFTVSGETVSAVVQCPVNDDLPDRVKLNGRIGADSMDLLLTVEQKIPDKSTVRLKMRVTSERIGECP